jgi:hypothetical protein
MLPRKRGIST